MPCLSCIHHAWHRVAEASTAIADEHTWKTSLLPDAANAQVLVWVGDGLVPRAYASMSVLDSTVQA